MNMKIIIKTDGHTVKFYLRRKYASCFCWFRVVVDINNCVTQFCSGAWQAEGMILLTSVAVLALCCTNPIGFRPVRSNRKSIEHLENLVDAMKEMSVVLFAIHQKLDKKNSRICCAEWNILHFLCSSNGGCSFLSILFLYAKQNYIKPYQKHLCLTDPWLTWVGDFVFLQMFLYDGSIDIWTVWYLSLLMNV